MSSCFTSVSDAPLFYAAGASGIVIIVATIAHHRTNTHALYQDAVASLYLFLRSSNSYQNNFVIFYIMIEWREMALVPFLMRVEHRINRLTQVPSQLSKRI